MIGTNGPIPADMLAHPSEVRLDDVASRVVSEMRAAPAATVAAARRTANAGPPRRGVGAAGRLFEAEDSPAASVDTPFDLASLTKPVVALAFARLEVRQVIRRHEPLQDVLTEARGTPSGEVPLDLLFAHRAGLVDHVPLWTALETHGVPLSVPEAIHAIAAARRPECTGAAPREGFPPVYSDLGYILAGLAIAARVGRPLDEVVSEEVSGPLGLRIGSARWWRRNDASFDERVAPTELAPWRGGVVRGVVHDENAFALSGDATSGHAGLFGDASSVAALGLAVLEVLAGERGAWLSAAALAPLVARRPGGSHRAGFDSKSGPTPSSGARFGDETFGHLGFTGTSLWMDPAVGLSAALLTNRVHPSREHVAIRAARPAAYDAIFDAMVDAHPAQSEARGLTRR
jgi:CubicO group peptidase (beta-lactamase class C family)